MPDSRPYSIAKQFAAWASAITVANGYNTDAGNNVLLGRRFVDADVDKFPLVSVLWAGEVVSTVETEHEEQVNITVSGFVKLPGVENDPDIADLLFQDIRKAILSITDLPYVIQIIPTSFETVQPDADSLIIRTAMVYAATYFENYGA